MSNEPNPFDDEIDFELGEQLAHRVIQRLINKRLSSSRSTHSRRYIDRDRETGHAQLVNDYFSDHPVYPAHIFRRRFRMRKYLFLHIVSALEVQSEYFQQRLDAVGRMSFSPLQKCTVAIRQLAYGSPADVMDEYLRIGESTAIECVINFCRGVIDIFGARYLRRPTATDITRLVQMHEQRHGFPGMLGSLDCMHWVWRNCPVAWKGQFTRGDHKAPTIMLEAVVSQDLWIWHAFFWVAGARNDINVLNESPLFNDVLQGTAHEVVFTVNDTQYTKGYYFTDGIYLEWSCLVKSFRYPDDPKRKKFKERQKSARKDIERAFGVLQSRWAIVRGPARFWYKKDLKDIMLTCIILHNMIVEDEGDDIVNWTDDDGNAPTQPTQGSTDEFHEYLRRNSELRDSQVHHQLRADLVEH